MKMLNANEVQLVSGGDRESQERLEEFLRRMDDYMRRQHDYVPAPDLP